MASNAGKRLKAGQWFEDTICPECKRQNILINSLNSNNQVYENPNIYFYQSEDKVWGPHDLETIIEQIGNGNIARGTPVQLQRQGKWFPAENFPQLVNHLPAPSLYFYQCHDKVWGPIDLSTVISEIARGNIARGTQVQLQSQGVWAPAETFPQIVGHLPAPVLYFYQCQNKVWGPSELETIIDQISKGNIARGTQVQLQSQGTWAPAENFPHIVNHLPKLNSANDDNIKAALKNRKQFGSSKKEDSVQAGLKNRKQFKS
jgi:hypothetical protein